MGLEMGDTLLYDFMHSMTAVSLEMSDEPIFIFLEHDKVPRHDNSIEGIIRIFKVKTKVAGCFRTNDEASEFASFHSIAETAKRNGISKFKSLYKLVSDMAIGNFFDELFAEND